MGNKPKNIKKDLNKIIAEINKQFDGVVIKIASEDRKIERIPTKVKEIDELIGGGFPCGRVSVVWGGEGVGKSSLMAHLVKSAQEQGKTVIYLDLENKLDVNWFEKLGVDISKLLVGRFKVAEQALDTIIKLAKEKAVDVIILDSIQSLSPKGEQETKAGKEKSVEEDTMALLARKLSQFFRMAIPHIYRANICLVMIGQTRTDIGGFIALQTLSGGMALKHNASIILHLRRGKKADAPTETYYEEKEVEDEVIDKETGEVKIVKKKKKYKKHRKIGFSVVMEVNKMQLSDGAREGTEIEIPFYFESGFIKLDPKG